MKRDLLEKPITVCLDFHGAIFDHRVSKHYYFGKQKGIVYSNPFLERNAILKEIRMQEPEYLDLLEEFLESDYSLSGHFVIGFEKFIAESPQNWRFIVLSGTTSGIKNVKKVLHFSNLTRISGVYCIPRESKLDIARQLNASVYFDDRDDLFDQFNQKQIITVQVNRAENKAPSQKARLVYENWNDVTSSIKEINGLINV